MTQYPKFPPEQAAKPSITERIILALIHSEKESRARKILTDLYHEFRSIRFPKELGVRARQLIEYATERCNGMAPRCGHWIVQYVMHENRPQYRLECAVCFHVYGIFDWDVNDAPPKVEVDPDFEVKDADPKNIKYEPMKPFTMVDEEISRETHDAIQRERKPWSNCPLCLGNGGPLIWGLVRGNGPGSVETNEIEECECWRAGEAYAKQIERRRERDVAFDEPRTTGLREEELAKIRGEVHAATIAAVRESFSKSFEALRDPIFASNEMSRDAAMACIDEVARMPPPNSVLEIPRKQFDAIFATAKRNVRVEIELRLDEVFRKERATTERWEGRHGLDRLARIESLVREALQG